MKIKTLAAVFFLIIMQQLNAQPTEIIGTGLLDLRNSKIAIGDINNDSRIDIVISGINSVGDYQCLVYTKNSNNTYSNLGANIIAVVDGDIALADFNADNYLDIAICGRDASNTKYSKIYRNNKNNTFTEISASIKGLYLGSLAWGDYDNDADLDLLICGQDASNVRKTLIYENTGNENFTEVVPNIPVSRGQATWGDINNDGLLDIALSGLDNSNNYITEIYTNTGNRSFISHNANLQKLAFTNQNFVDYDNDGDLDLFISGSNSSGTNLIKLYKNNSANFVEQNPFTALWNVSSSWGDYDADGDADLIYIGLAGSTPTVYYYRNDGSDVFTLINLSTNSIAEGDIHWLDFNSDFKTDILISGSTSSGQKTALYQNNLVATNSAPNAPTALSANIKGNIATLSWTAANDAQTPAAGLSYRLCLGTSPGNYNILAPMANASTGKSYLPKQGPIKGISTIIKNLPEGKYYWSIQSIDASAEASGLAVESSFSICNPASLGANRAVCSKGLLELSAGTAADIINWYSENNGLIASNTQNLSCAILQSDKISVEIIKSIGCTVKDTIDVTALALPSVVLPASSQDCLGDTISLEAGLAGEIIKWYSQDNSLIYAGKKLEYKITKNETIKCEITALNGCIDSAKVAISYFALPQATLGNDYGVCKGKSTLLQIDGMQKVDWYALPWKSIATNQSQIDVKISQDTSIVAKFFNASNCFNQDTINIKTNLNLKINAGNDTTICYNTNLTLGSNPTISGGAEPYVYIWTNASNQVISSISNPIVKPAASTFYNLNVNDKNGCEAADKINVAVNPKSKIDAGENTKICMGMNTILGGNPTAENSLFPYNYQWLPKTGLSNPNTANPVASPLNTTTYRLIVSTYLCIADTAFVTVSVNPLPDITITESKNIGYGETVLLEASGGISYEWLPKDDLAFPYSAQTEASPQKTTIYQVTVTDENNCQNQDSVTLTLKNDLFIPTLFTPNNDGKNDSFKVYGTGLDKMTMIIYNANGNIVFQSDNLIFLIENGWDGSANGTKQPQGSYMYTITGQFKDGSHIGNNKGVVNLMR